MSSETEENKAIVRRFLEELGERGHVGGEDVYLGLQAAGEGRREGGRFLQASLK